jgi:hypothetical protein
LDRAKFAAVDPKWWVLLAVGVGSMLGGIDLSVANIVLPVVRREFACSVATIEWAVTIYLLVVCGFLLTFGRLGDLRGQKRLFISGFVVFMLGSALCGAAWSATALIVARAFQGLGASMIFASAPAILTGNFPATQRGQALGLQAIMVYLGQMTGPALGGWLTDHFSWRAVFYINLPVGALALLLTSRFIPRDEPRKQAEPFDFAGAGLFLAGFSVLLLGLNQGYDRGWTSPSIQGLLAAGYAAADRVRASGAPLGLSAARLKTVSRTAVCDERGQCGVELPFRIHDHIPHAVLPHTGTRADSRPCGTADHDSAGDHGRLRSDQRHRFRSPGHALAFDGGHGYPGHRPVAALAPRNPALPWPTSAWEWACADWAREYSLRLTTAP